MAKYHKSPSNPKKTIRCRAKGDCPFAKSGGVVVNAQNSDEAKKQIAKRETAQKRTKRKGLEIPKSVLQNQKSNRKVKRLYSMGMNVGFVSSYEDLHSRDSSRISTGKHHNAESLINAPSSDVDFFTDDINGMNREELIAQGNPLSRS